MPVLSNWNGEIRFEVANDRFKSPTGIAEIQSIVKEASSKNQRVTVIGALHSTTSCMVGSDVVISMKNMARILSVDKEKLMVTVQGGVSLHQLCTHLRTVGLHAPVILEFGTFQIGAISGTHANDTSMTRGAQFSSFVIGVKLINPNGDVMEVSESVNAEYLPAIRSHFGLFGVICEVTVRVFKDQPLHINHLTTKVDKFLQGFAKEVPVLRNSYDQVFGIFFPSSGTMLWQCRKFLKDGALKPEPLEKLIDSVESKGINLYKDFLLPIVKAGTALHPSAPFADLLSTSLIEVPLKLIAHTSYTIDPSERGIIYEKDDPDFEFYDWAFPEDTWVEMTRAFIQLTDRFREERGFIPALPVLIYFIPQDKASFLSRSRNSNMVALDPQHADPKDPNWKQFRLEFNEIATVHGGVPHINKTRDGAISHFAKSIDQEALRLYLQLRKQLDPKNTFLNDYFKTMFAAYL